MMCGLVAAGACLLASCASETDVSTRITGQVTGLWQGATLEVAVRSDSADSVTRVDGRDLQPGPPTSDAVDFELGIDGPDGAPYEVVVEHVAAGFTCTAIRGRTGVIVDGEAPPVGIACTPPVFALGAPIAGPFYLGQPGSCREGFDGPSARPAGAEVPPDELALATEYR
jgi:hypothetical protein